jgi:hypothetical protein
MPDSCPEDLEQLAQRGFGGLAGDLWHLVRQTRKWWLAPLLVLFLLFGLLLLLNSSVAPFIYTLF